jgi:hypothetical protein
MHFQETLFLAAGGLFDFDLTFGAEAILFLLLAFVVTFVFLSPVSQQLDKRAESINYTLRKSALYLTFGYNKLSSCLDLLTTEVSELNRQLKLTKTYTTDNFENEINDFQKENGKLLSKLKGTLSVQSAFLLSSIEGELTFLTDSFSVKSFNLKFQLYFYQRNHICHNYDLELFFISSKYRRRIFTD